MTGEARLRSLRVVGFKSFAERTTLEFGPGISAIVGPNGSGKSNLADALRWALGEQGRTLRTHRSEDVIFAGSATRRAIGLAEVTLTLENGDGLLPVAYGEVALARRLYRSGENEYLLNGQRVRLRDLLDLLDGANLADNAFLFIGQGMVDQALSLRPEERRPLFEEAAGVRRHERRRRQAEARLLEAEANLARVRDIAGELRPQVRRLAQQAEQQVARQGAGAALAGAVVMLAAHRWSTAAAALAGAETDLQLARAQAQAAADALAAADAEARDLLTALADHATRARQLRQALDDARQRLTEHRVADERRAAEAAAIERERAALATERATIEPRLEEARRAMALADAGGAVAATAELTAEVAGLERQIAQAAAELAALEDQHRASDARAASAARARRAGEDELARITQHAAMAAQRADEAAHAAEEAAAALAREAQALAGHAEAVRSTAAAEAQARTTQAAADASARATTRRATDAAAGRAAVEARHAALKAQLDAIAAPADAANAGWIQAATRRGGRALANGLEVTPGLRPAVEAALGAAVEAYVVDETDVIALREGRGHLALRLATATSDAAGRGVTERARDAGGGALTEAIRRDPTGVAGQLLRTSVWLPSLEAVLALLPRLPEGWQAVSVAGDIVTAQGLVRLGRPEAALERRDEVERRTRELADVDVQVQDARAAHEAAEVARAEAGTALARADAAIDEAVRSARAAVEQERAATRRHEALLRESAWAAAQAERLAVEQRAANAALAAATPDVAAPDALAVASGSPAATADASAVDAWRARLEALRARRAVLEAELRTTAQAERAADDRRLRAELAVTADAERLAATEARMAEATVRLESLAAAGAAASETRAHLEAGVAAADADARAVDTDEAAGRDRLTGVEARAATHRADLHAGEERAQRAEVSRLEARLGLEAIREQVLTELAGLGPLGLEALEGAPRHVDEDALAAELEAALDLAAAGWTEPGAGPAVSADGLPTAAQLATLRRRYHEIGASNPFAAQEHAEMQARLEALDTQRHDLERAMADTQRLIAELSERIREQFARTFAALERAFGRRFGQLFDGGDAQLVLTDPDDLAATGIEIMARPPGKKRQALGMLSGGERALTAVALLFAMLDVHPVPFCVLDEVDAALDEANVGRFTEALRDLARTTQFLVITHNRGTIESADALYGITIGDDAISHVISLRLAEATELAQAAG